jgi:hypothetical protein
MMDRELADKIWAHRQRKERKAKAQRKSESDLIGSGIFLLKQEIEFLKDALRELSEKMRRRGEKC